MKTHEETMTLVERYKGYLQELANMQAKIRDMRDSFEEDSREFGDNGDPQLDAEQVLIDMGSLLADLVTYALEYEAEAKGNPKA